MNLAVEHNEQDGHRHRAQESQEMDVDQEREGRVNRDPMDAERF